MLILIFLGVQLTKYKILGYKILILYKILKIIFVAGIRDIYPNFYNKCSQTTNVLISYPVILYCCTPQFSYNIRTLASQIVSHESQPFVNLVELKLENNNIIHTWQRQAVILLGFWVVGSVHMLWGFKLLSTLNLFNMSTFKRT